MDAQDCSADVVEVEASGRRESKVVAAVRARSVDYQAIVDDTVADFAPNTAHRRSKIYAHARLVVAHGLMSMGLDEALIEVEKLALDLAIERVEQQWRAKGATEKLPAEGSAAYQAMPLDARLRGGRAVGGSAHIHGEVVQRADEPNAFGRAAGVGLFHRDDLLQCIVAAGL